MALRRWPALLSKYLSLGDDYFAELTVVRTFCFYSKYVNKFYGKTVQ